MIEITQSMINTLFNILTALFNEVFKPVVTDILVVVLQLITFKISVWINYLGYWLLLMLCKILDGLEHMVNVFAGVENIVVDNRSIPLMELIFKLDVVSQAFVLVTFCAAGLCVLFTVFSVVRSMSSMTLENKNPITHVLKNAMKACVSFMLVPFLCVFMLQISTVMIRHAQTAVTGGVETAEGRKQPSLGLYVFLVSSLRAGKEGIRNAGAEGEFDTGILSAEYLEPSMNDELRLQYLKGEKKYQDPIYSAQDFSIYKIDYLTGIITSCVMAIIFVGLIIQFLRRMLELVMLYIVAPFFSATIPLDDGQLFKRWREMFLAKFLAGFGVIFALKLFMLLLPVIFSDNLNLGEVYTRDEMLIWEAVTKSGEEAYRALVNQTDLPEADKQELLKAAKDGDMAMNYALEKNGLNKVLGKSFEDNLMSIIGMKDFEEPTLLESKADSFLKLIFVIGILFALYKSQALLLEILNPQAAQDAKQSTMLAMAMVMKGVKAVKKTATMGMEAGVMAAEAGVAIGTGVATAGVGTAATVGAVAAKKTAVTGAKVVGKTAAKAGKSVAKKTAKSVARKTASAAKEGVGKAAGTAAGAMKNSADREA